MKKRYVSYLAAALAGVLAVGCLAGCGKKDTAGKGDLTTVTLNEVAHSIFYAPRCMWPSKKAISKRRALRWSW